MGAMLVLGVIARTNAGRGSGQRKIYDKENHSEDSKSLWSRIQDGRSFVDENSRLSPWLFASDPHGTQMANLICTIDPFCEIYVARVAEDSSGITSERVAKAIKWARDREVDVISMSFAVGDYSKALVEQINQAAAAGIVMTCSTHDEGPRIVEVYVLTACDEYGKLLRDVEEDKYHYRIRGQNMTAGVIPFLKSEETISGSSVSTTLAAGLSSLILTCHRVRGRVGSIGVKGPNTRWVIVEKHFRQM